MIKNVQYKGYTASPSDYECTDGELDMSLNMVYEDGSLRPILPPKFLTSSGGNNVKCLHKTSNYLHYIMIGDNQLKFKKDNLITPIFDFPADIEIYQITPVGNTLVVLTSDGMYYFLWKEDKYISLGNELPELNVNPYISTQILNATNIKEKFKFDFEMDTNYGLKIPLKTNNTAKYLYDNTIYEYLLQGEERQEIYNTIFSLLNSYSEKLKNQGYFFEPFYVRFAYRMFDGSHICHTVPVLLVPTTWGKPIMSVNINKSIDDVYNAYFNPIYSLSKLFADITLPDNISSWKDLITHIDVFVTEPLIDYADDAKSLLRILKFPAFYYQQIKEVREYIAPDSMICKDNNEMEWESINSYIDEQNNKKSVITYFGEATFVEQGLDVNHRGWASLNPIDLKGTEYIAFDCSQFSITCSRSMFYMDFIEPVVLNLDTDLKLTVFNIKDLYGTEYVYFWTQNIKDKGSVKVKTYLINTDIRPIDKQLYIETKRIDGNEYTDIINNSNTFYKVAELNLTELNFHGCNKEVSIKETTLQNLVTRPTLSDIGSGINKVISSDAFSYNNRLNIVADKLKLTSANTSLKMQNPSVNNTASNDTIKKAYVEIFENNQYAYVEIPAEDLDFNTLIRFSFPNNNAKNLFLYVTEKYTLGQSYYRYKIRLQQHNYLNLSYVFDGFAKLYGDDSSSMIYEKEQLNGEYDFIVPSNNTIEYGNIIRLSDVNNPFRFSEEYTVSLPVTKIYALSTAAKALSQGQFGQYPLYAFTSEGIWALELTSTGTYSARQPISRDVVINKESITQIDSSVLFATDRGIMLISGSQVICISDKINSMDLFAFYELPKADRLVDIYKGIGAKVASLDDIALLPFNEFLKECRMLYDYPHQHIIVYNPNVKYAYVYSLKSQQWGMILSNITYGISSYPEALAVEGNNIVDFSKTGSDVAAAMIVTRPLDMEHTDVFKTVRDIFQRGNMKDAKAKQVLYGSNDLNNWFLVWSSDNMHMGGFGGSPWKYYRIVMIREFDKSESIYGFSVQYDTRLTNRLR